MSLTYRKDIAQGRFVPKNPQKYAGDPNNIVYRSGLEHSFMRWCDERSSVIKWASEELAIPYVSPKDNLAHRYFVDFAIQVKTKTGIKTYLIEVKPFRYTKEPERPKRQTKRFIAEVVQWGVNNAKWEAARKYAKKRGWEFMLITEKDLQGINP